MNPMLSYFRIAFYAIAIVANLFMIRRAKAFPLIIILILTPLMANALMYAIGAHPNSEDFQILITIMMGVVAMMSVYELSKPNK